MAISSTTCSSAHDGSGTAGPFPLGFTLLAAADLLVYLVDDTTGARTDYELNTHYTIDADLEEVTMEAGFEVAAGTTLHLERAPALTQPTDFTPGGIIRETVLERALDRIVMLVQWVALQLSGALRGDALGDAATRAGKLVGFDAGGDPELLTPAEVVAGGDDAFDLAIGTVTTGDPDDPAAATVTGTYPNKLLNLLLPRGDTGITNGLLFGEGTPDSELGIDGQGYVDILSGAIYAKAAGSWAIAYEPTTYSFYADDTVPEDTFGANGDIFLLYGDGALQSLYEKQAGEWVKLGEVSNPLNDYSAAENGQAMAIVDGEPEWTNELVVIPPIADPRLAGALWNNSGTPAISAGIDDDAMAYIEAVEAALGSRMTSTQWNAINDFVEAEKTASRWTLHKRIYLPVWANADANKVDMVTATAAGAWIADVTHSAGYVQADGDSGGFDFNVGCQTLGMTNTSGCMWAICLQADSGTDNIYMVGGRDSETSKLSLHHLSSSSVYFYAFNTTTGEGTCAFSLNRADQVGVFVASRHSAGWDIIRAYSVGTSSVYSRSDAAGYGTVPAGDIYAMRSASVSMYSDGKYGGYGASLGMDATDATEFADALKTLWETVTGDSLP